MESDEPNNFGHLSPTPPPRRGGKHSARARQPQNASHRHHKTLKQRRAKWGPAEKEQTVSKKVLHFSTRALVLFAAGLLFALSATQAQPEGSRYDSDLVYLVDRKQASVNALKSNNDELYRQIDEMIANTPEKAHLAAWERTRVDFEGPGIVVTLDDAPAVDPLPEGVTADSLVIHQQDIETVFNALWSGGAEIMSVQGNHVRADSQIVCVGNVINIDGRLYSPPYKIAAIGPAQQMREALANDPQIAIIQQYVARYNLGYSVREEKNIHVKAAKNQPSFDYVKVAANESNL